MNKKKKRKDKPVEEETSQQLGMFQTDLMSSVLGNVLDTEEDNQDSTDEVEDGE